MESFITERIALYQQNKKLSHINAFREVMQEITLYALSNAGFFTIASFCGGTSLRIAYQLPRASEDLDFSALKPLEDFSFEKYFPSITNVFSKLGIDVKVSEKKSFGAVKSAFIKSDTLVRELYIESINPIGPVASLKIKMEIDTNPPLGANYEYKSSLFPFPHSYLIQDLPSLFAGKIHALLCRGWEKGRDYYDYLFYLKNDTGINLIYLENAIKQNSPFILKDKLTYKKLEELLIEKFESINFETAKEDCARFINNPEELNFWNKELFVNVTKDYFSHLH